ncbi:MAG: cytochrome c [Armatimonadota bacterium]|nr:cytochrome c [Armatimonadota bacterium]MDR5697074.1 cytochrome c [Armatimonadota bacterium]
MNTSFLVNGLGAMSDAAVVVGILVALAGAGLAVHAAATRAHRTVRGRSAIAAGIVTFGLGVLVVRGSLAPPVDPFALRNPFPATFESVAIGERVYRQNCEVCHGPEGAGDGPLAATLRPRPVDFRVHMAMGHPDGQLFLWISNGIPGTAMPAWRGRLTEEERWHVINFIRSLAPVDR